VSPSFKKPSAKKPSASPRDHLSLLVLVLGFLTAFGPLSIDMYLPAFPEIAKTFSALVSYFHNGTVIPMVAVMAMSSFAALLIYGLGQVKPTPNKPSGLL